MFQELIRKPQENIVMFLIVLLISTILLRFLWNTTLVPHITVLKPIKTLLDAFLLSFGLIIIRG